MNTAERIIADAAQMADAGTPKLLSGIIASPEIAVISRNCCSYQKAILKRAGGNISRSVQKKIEHAIPCHHCLMCNWHYELPRIDIRQKK